MPRRTLRRSYYRRGRKVAASGRYRRTKRRASSHRWRPRGLEIPPARAQQIQQALIQDGDLHASASGHWDSQTRQAMKLYQEKNGFQPTGLPDAKSLMKMGLGPHPLPPQLDPLAQAGSGPSAPASTPQSSDIPPQ
ncbi:MAG: peptidoglycan-binding protein [Acidobacteriota bacterium]|nr:peptidoglycan-binding protein [Acidobacteriota bacterium]